MYRNEHVPKAEFNLDKSDLLHQTGGIATN